MGIQYNDRIALNIAMDTKGVLSGSRSVVDAMSRMSKSFVYTRTDQEALNQQMLNSKRIMSESEMIQKRATSELLRYASAASTAGVASFYLFNQMNKAVKEAGSFQKTLVDVNIAAGNIGNNFNSSQTAELVKNIKNAQSHIYSLNDAAKAYFVISSAGMQGTTRWGKDITQLGVHYAKLYHSLSRGKVSLEDASNFIPELLAKTGATLELQFNNGETQMERYLDMMGKAEVLTKIKMENMRDILDATGASWRNLGVSFAAGLSVVGTQMSAGQSARSAGQSAKSLFNKFQGDIASLGAHSMLYGADDGTLNKLDKLNMKVLKYQDDIAKAYGGTQQFQAIINGIISGKIDASAEASKLESMFKSGVLSAKGFNALFGYYKGLQNLNDDSLNGTKQQKRLLLGLGMLYGNGDPSSKASVEAGKKRYQEMITEVKLGNMSVNELLKELGDKLDVMSKDGKKGVYNAMLASRFIFPDVVAQTAFLNTMNARAKVSQDVYLTDERTGERVKSLDQLSYKDQVKYKEMLSKKLIDETVKGIRLYKAGQFLRGADVNIYTEKAAQDSAHLAATTFAATMKTFEKRLVTIGENFETIRTNIGESFMEPVSGATDVVLGFTDSLRILTNTSQRFSSLLGSMTGSVASVLAIMAAVMGVKAIGKFGGGMSSFLGLPTKSGQKEAAGNLQTLETRFSKLKEARASVVAKNAAMEEKLLKLDSGYKMRLNAIKTKDGYSAEVIQAMSQKVSRRYTARVEKVKEAIDSSNTDKKLKLIDKRLKNIGIAYENAKNLYNLNYGGDYTGFFKEVGRLNEESGKTAKGFKYLRASMSNFGKVFSARGGLGGMFNRGYMNLMGSPAAMMGTMGSIGLMTWGLSQMRANDSFGINNILGNRESGRPNLLNATLNKYNNMETVKAGGKLSWDDLLGMLSDKNEFTKYKNMIESARGTRQTLVGESSKGASNAALQVVAEVAARNGQFTEGYFNTLFGNESERILRGFSAFGDINKGMPKYLEKDEAGNYKIADKDLLEKAKNAGLNEAAIDILRKGGTEQFRASVDRISSSPGAYKDWLTKTTDIETKLAEMVNFKKDPWGYNLWKWFQGVGGKYLESIAFGVGAGSLGLGAIFGKPYLGGIYGLLTGLLVGQIQDLLGGSVDEKVSALTGIIGMVGGAAGGMFASLAKSRAKGDAKGDAKGKWSRALNTAVIAGTVGDVVFSLAADAVQKDIASKALVKDIVAITREGKNIPLNTNPIDGSKEVLLEMAADLTPEERKNAGGLFNIDFMEAIFNNYTTKFRTKAPENITHSLEAAIEYDAALSKEKRKRADMVNLAPYAKEEARKMSDIVIGHWENRKDYQQLKATYTTDAFVPNQGELAKFIIPMVTEEYQRLAISNPKITDGYERYKMAKGNVLETLKNVDLAKFIQGKGLTLPDVDDTEMKGLSYDEKVSKPFDDNTDATRDAAYATEQLTKQLKDTEDVWFFDMNKGLYDSSIYNPRDKKIKNDTAEETGTGGLGMLKVEIDEGLKNLVKFRYEEAGVKTLNTEFGLNNFGGNKMEQAMTNYSRSNPIGGIYR